MTEEAHKQVDRRGSSKKEDVFEQLNEGSKTIRSYNNTIMYENIKIIHHSFLI